MMTVHEIKDYSESNASWTIDDCLERIREIVKDNPDRNQMIVLLKDGKPGRFTFTQLIVNMRNSEQAALLSVAQHCVCRELAGDDDE